MHVCILYLQHGFSRPPSFPLYPDEARFRDLSSVLIFHHCRVVVVAVTIIIIIGSLSRYREEI